MSDSFLHEPHSPSKALEGHVCENMHAEKWRGSLGVPATSKARTPNSAGSSFLYFTVCKQRTAVLIFFKCLKDTMLASENQVGLSKK